MPYKNPEDRRVALAKWRATNKDAIAARHKAWRDRNTEHCAAYRKQYRGMRGPAHRKDRYGLTPDAFNAMVEAQGGKCAICQCEPRGAGTMGVLRVDHDHETGMVRALLCHRCNAGLGMFSDEAARIFRAAMYLAAHAGDKRESA
jgi:hypothetical protein